MRSHGSFQHALCTGQKCSTTGYPGHASYPLVLRSPRAAASSGTRHPHEISMNSSCWLFPLPRRLPLGDWNRRTQELRTPLISFWFRPAPTASEHVRSSATELGRPPIRKLLQLRLTHTGRTPTCAESERRSVPDRASRGWP